MHVATGIVRGNFLFLTHRLSEQHHSIQVGATARFLDREAAGEWLAAFHKESGGSGNSSSGGGGGGGDGDGDGGDRALRGAASISKRGIGVTTQLLVVREGQAAVGYVLIPYSISSKNLPARDCSAVYLSPTRVSTYGVKKNGYG